MGKLYQADSNKREGAKQDDWLSSVTEALTKYQGPLRYLVDRLQAYDNIPRKQKAFENFVANSLNLKRDPATVTKLWQIVEPCLKRSTGSDSTASKNAPVAWKSYRDETLDILNRSGGSLPWKLLQANLAKRRKATHPNEDYETIRVNVLANIPSEYLSEKTNLVVVSPQ
jgi:cell growth-regulating nucleolar protein